MTSLDSIVRAQRIYTYQGLSQGIAALSELRVALDRLQLPAIASLVDGAVSDLEAAYAEAKDTFERAEGRAGDVVTFGPIVGDPEPEPLASRGVHSERGDAA